MSNKLKAEAHIALESSIAPTPGARVALLLERHPDQIDGAFSYIPRFMPFADIDRRLPPHLAIRRCVRVSVFGLVFRPDRPLPSLAIDEQHIRMMRVHTLPLPPIP